MAHPSLNIAECVAHFSEISRHSWRSRSWRFLPRRPAPGRQIDCRESQAPRSLAGHICDGALPALLYWCVRPHLLAVFTISSTLPEKVAERAVLAVNARAVKSKTVVMAARLGSPAASSVSRASLAVCLHGLPLQKSVFTAFTGRPWAHSLARQPNSHF